MSLLHRQALKQRVGGGLPPMPPPGVGGKKKPLSRTRDYSPVYWDKYFERMHDVQVRENTFRVYECGSEGPVLFFLHGGGFSALSWAVLSSCVSHLVTCRCAAVDLRGHGDSVSTDDINLSADVMSSDVGDIVKELYGDEPPPIVLVGHSMGGAIAVHTACRFLIPSLAGLVVIDVVEGTALEALSSMQSFLRGRPKMFTSLENAIEWCVRSGQVRNLDSAKVSMVGQVKRTDTNETGSAVMEHEHEHLLHPDHCNNPPEHAALSQQQQQTTPIHPPALSHSCQDTISEEDEEEEGSEVKEGKISPTANQNETDSKAANQEQGQNSSPTNQGTSSSGFKQPTVPNVRYTWRIDLGQTEPYWRGWFEGLSTKFLSCDVPKMLLLAGVDRLDKDLTIGQMQGKFQMQVLPRSGHAVHEDVPEQVAEALATFLTRHKMAIATANFQPVFPGC